VETLPKPDVPVPKLRQFRYQARPLDAAEMAKLKPQKRYALAVVFTRAQYAQALDDAAHLLSPGSKDAVVWFRMRLRCPAPALSGPPFSCAAQRRPLCC
jgi:hypothetical protein